MSIDRSAALVTDLPDSWADEPWPLDDPVPPPSLRPVNWSDTHADPPQVADLADEAWQRAVDRGISMGQALAELQREAQYHQEIDRQIIHGSTYRSAMGFATGSPVKIAHTVRVPQGLLDDMRSVQTDFEDAWRRVQQMFADPSPITSKVQEMADRQKGDQALDDVKRATIVPSYRLEDPS